MNEYRLKLKNLDCADCAAELEEKISKLEGVRKCSIDFMNGYCIYACPEEKHEAIEQKIRALIRTEEPDVVIEASGKTDDQDDEKEKKSRVLILIVGAVIMIIGLFLKGPAQVVLLVASYVVLGYEVLYKAVRNLLRGNVFDENFLMALATVAALLLQDYREAAAVMLFYQIGEYFEDRAVEKSRQSIGELMDIRPDYAFVQRNGSFVKVSPEDVKIGEIIQVKPGERVPLDGIVLQGTSSLDTASLTGESQPRDVEPQDAVISGCVNQTGLLQIQVTKAYGESTVAKILNLVRNAESRKAKTENFITKFSRIYTPTVVGGAVILAVVMIVSGASLRDAVTRACTFLVISCPCALVISIPLSFFAGIGGLSSQGILVKGSNVVETLAKVDQVVMDKTGTLTSGKFAVEQIIGDPNTLRDAAYAEHASNHPIGEGIRTAYAQPIDEKQISDVQEIPGRGLQVQVDGRTILAGNYKLMQDHSIACQEQNVPGTLVYVAADGSFEGCLVLRDQLKSDAVQAVQDLHQEKKKCILVSGDNEATTKLVAEKLHADQAFGGCLPEEKVQTVERLKQNGVTAFVGDGVNDAPVLTASDIGIAMGALGSDAAIEAADVVIMDDAPSRISMAIRGARRILRIANENIWGAISIKIVILILGALGYAGMWLAIFADVGLAILCILNSMRLLSSKPARQVPQAA